MTPSTILLVSDFAFPVTAGTERLVFGVAEYFTNKLGIRTDILTPNWNNLPEKETRNGVTIYRFKTHSIEKAAPLRRVFDFVKAGLKLPRYDIYHGFYTVPPLASAVLLARLKIARSVSTFFSAEQLKKNYSSFLKRILISSLLNLTDFVTVYTWKLEQEFRENFFPNKPIVVTQGWVEKSFKKQESQKNGREKIVLFVGRMTEEKGIFVLLKSFARISDRVKARLVLIGPPYKRELVEVSIENLGIVKKTSVLGFVSEAELSEWYNRCEVVAVPALHADAFGFSLMEAMACGKPVITTQGVGLADLENKELIVPPGDVNALEKALLLILSDKKYYESASLKAGKLVRVFDKKTVMQKYLDVYSRVLQ